MKISIEQIVGYLLVVCLAGNTIVEAFGFGNLPLVGDLVSVPSFLWLFKIPKTTSGFLNLQEKKIGSLIPAGLPKPPVNISDMVQGISTNALDLQMMGDQSHSNDSTALADETNKKPAEDFVEQVFHSPKDKVEEVQIQKKKKQCYIFQFNFFRHFFSWSS